MADDEPLFTALAIEIRPLLNLLRCVAISPVACVEITTEGLKFITEEMHAVQASTVLDKSLFSSYILAAGHYDPIPPFKIHINNLLETLSMFGMSDSTSAYGNRNGGITSSYAAAFSTPALGLGARCKFTYAETGSSLRIVIDENNVTTTCEMTTYTIQQNFEEDNEIPLDRGNLVMKIIMPSIWLHDAVTELAKTSPSAMIVNASSISSPYFALESVGGAFGESSVNFAPEARSESGNDRRRRPTICEVFVIAAPVETHGRIKQKYQFDWIKRAGKAMDIASKVSIRMDRQGVLSLQFMILPRQVDDSGALELIGLEGEKYSFVDYRFVPLVDGDDEDSDEDANGHVLSDDPSEGE